MRVRRANTDEIAPDPSPSAAAAELEDSETEASEPDAEPELAEIEESEPEPEPEPSPTPDPRLFLVSDVTDGDTIDLSNGETVRIVGIDTPERSTCGYDKATASMERMVLGERVRLIKPRPSTDNRDRYDRMLRYVMRGKMDTGIRQIKRGLAIARYDSRDGYGFHPREDRYHRVDDQTKNVNCPKPPSPPPEEPASAGNCEAGYEPCVPLYPPDLDCADVNGPIYVTGSDPHGFDGEGDGVGCE